MQPQNLRDPEGLPAGLHCSYGYGCLPTEGRAGIQLSNHGDREGNRALTSLNIFERSMELNALLKSIRRVQHSSGLEFGSSRTQETEWTMTSHPDFTPTPSWWGERTWMASCFRAAERDLETSRRKTSPTAMGRKPPPFFCRQ